MFLDAVEQLAESRFYTTSHCRILPVYCYCVADLHSCVVCVFACGYEHLLKGRRRASHPPPGEQFPMYALRVRNVREAIVPPMLLKGVYVATYVVLMSETCLYIS